MKSIKELIKDAIESYDLDRTQDMNDIAESYAKEFDWNYYYNSKKIYIKSLKKFQIYEQIYRAIQETAMDWASDNSRIDATTIYGFLEAFTDAEIQSNAQLDEFEMRDISFVTTAILNNQEIYLDDNYEDDTNE